MKTKLPIISCDDVLIKGAQLSKNPLRRYATSVPVLFALFRGSRILDNSGFAGMALLITRGLHVSSDFAKAIPLCSDAVVVAIAAMIAGGY